MEEILIKFESADKRRSIYIEDNKHSAWAYLKEGLNGAVLKDAFIYSPIEPRDEINKEEIAQGKPPVLIKKYASNMALLSNAKEDLFHVLWSADGNSVAILYDEEPIAAIYSTENRGYSKALSAVSGFGNPWSQELFNEHFASNC